MKLSRYTFVYSESDPPVITNLLSGYEFVIQKELLSCLQNGSFEQLDTETYEALIDANIITNVPHESVDFGVESNALEITYCLTYACNLECAYCIQKSSIPKDNNPQQPDSFITWLFQMLETNSYKSLFVHFFGGEPLLKPGSVTQIIIAAGNYCKQKNIGWGFSFTTNGTLLERSTIKVWNGLGLKSIDVTLDGPEQLHDQNRKDRNGNGTHQKIINRLRAINGLCPVTIICTINPNCTEPEPYIQFAEDLTREVEVESIRFKPYFTPEQKGTCFFQLEHGNMLKALWNESERRELPVEKGISNSPCGFFNNQSLVVGPSGSIFPCTPFLGRPDFSIGNVNDACVNVATKANIRDNLPQACLDCDFCPICFGGCRFVSIQKHNDAFIPSCEKEFFRSILSNI